MLRFSTLALFRGHAIVSVPVSPLNKCPCSVCNSAVMACIMAMVGRGVFVRAMNPAVLYIESWESTCPGVQHPETMRTGRGSGGGPPLVGGAQVNKEQQSRPPRSRASPLPSFHFRCRIVSFLLRHCVAFVSQCRRLVGGSYCTHFPCFRGGSGPHVTRHHSLHTCVEAVNATTLRLPTLTHTYTDTQTHTQTHTYTHSHTHTKKHSHTYILLHQLFQLRLALLQSSAGAE